MNLSLPPKKACCLLLVLLSFHIVKAQQTEEVSPAGTKFLQYLPPSYTPSSPSPLLVSLHGGNEIGDDLDELTVNTSHQIPAKLISTGDWPADRPFIVITPQLKRDPGITNFNDQEWPATLVNEVIEYVQSNYNVDANRIYLTGISLGAAGGWDYITAYPNKIAAFVPFSGKTRTEHACDVKDTPVWAFHGEADALVRPQFTIDMINAIEACSPSGKYKPRLNLLHAKAHEGWSEVYNGTQGYDIYNWLLKFSLNDNSNKAPYVNAGIDQKIMITSDPVHLTGDYFDSDGTITSVQWSKITGPSITLTDTDSKYLQLTNISVGTYEFELRATDNDGAESSDRIILEVLNTVGTEAAVTDLILIDSNNGNAEIGNLYEGFVIDKSVIGTGEINIRAVANSATGSVRFRINTDQHASTTNKSGPYYLKKSTQSWEVPNGEYTVCATAYKATGGNGAPGISLIFKVTVTGEAVATQTFYAKANSDISQLSSWGKNTDGTGAAPTSFTDNNQNFYITKSVTVDNALNISGTSSSFWVQSGGTLTINSNLTTIVNAEANTTINIYTNATPTFGSVSGTTVINIYGSSTIRSNTYGSLNLKGSGTTKTLVNNGTIIVAGQLTIDNGVTLNGNTGELSIGGDLVNNGTFTAGTSTVTINGIKDQTLTGAVTFNNLVISKSAGNITLSGTGPTLVNNTLTLTNGYIVSTASNKLTLSSNATLSGGSTSSYLTGPVVKTITAGGSFVFPVGSLSPDQYRPTTLSNTSAADTWTVEYVAGDPSDDGYNHNNYNSNTLSYVSQYEYWNISRTGSAAASTTLSYNTGSYSPPNIGNVADLRIAHWNGTSWDLPSGNGSLSQSGSATSGTVTLTNITSFSPVTIGLSDAPLPVKWLFFTATRQNHTIVLSFKTAEERNNHHFDVERAVDGLTFTVIGRKEGAGNSATPKYYEFLDGEVSPDQTYYYRIRQVDADGKFEYTGIVAVPAEGRSNTRWTLWPNPLHSHQALKFRLLDQSLDVTKPVSVKVVGLDGTLVLAIEGTADNLAARLNKLLPELSAGVYTIHLVDNKGQENFRLVLF